MVIQKPQGGWHKSALKRKARRRRLTVTPCTLSGNNYIYNLRRTTQLKNGFMAETEPNRTHCCEKSCRHFLPSFSGTLTVNATVFFILLGEHQALHLAESLTPTMLTDMDRHGEGGSLLMSQVQRLVIARHQCPATGVPMPCCPTQGG